VAAYYTLSGGELMHKRINLLIYGLAFSLFLWMFFLVAPLATIGAYNSTALVNTTVNITNAAPYFTRVVADTPINLIGYSNKTVFCNVTVFDYDNDTLTVNATFYLEGVASYGDIDDGNNHYTNRTCERTSPQATTMNYTCAFRVEYFANNHTAWRCNATVTDSITTVPGSNVSNYVTINPLVAIKLPTLLDYGNLETGWISNDTIANVTNAGNRNANISVQGYAVTPGDGLAFDCDSGSIALEHEKYDAVPGSPYSFMPTLTGSNVQIESFFVPQRISETADSYNNTYWKVYIPVGAGGTCNGKILFTASDRLG
jgi:hypothetical protein